MSKQILILSGSPRRGGNSDLLCNEFLRGAQDGGHQVEKIFIRDQKISPCRGCYACAKNDGVCAIKDDMAELLAKIRAAEVLVMSSPVYFYSIDAQMKTVIDRCVAQWLEIKNKEFYFIMTAAEEGETVMDCTLECFRGFAACVKGSQEKGVIYGKGVYEVGEIKAKPELLRQAYEMGKNA